MKVFLNPGFSGLPKPTLPEHFPSDDQQHDAFQRIGDLETDAPSFQSQLHFRKTAPLYANDEPMH